MMRKMTRKVRHDVSERDIQGRRLSRGGTAGDAADTRDFVLEAVLDQADMKVHSRAA